MKFPMIFKLMWSLSLSIFITYVHLSVNAFQTWITMFDVIVVPWDLCLVMAYTKTMGKDVL
jgi:hypothetical protein